MGACALYVASISLLGGAFLHQCSESPHSRDPVCESFSVHKLHQQLRSARKCSEKHAAEAYPS